MEFRIPWKNTSKCYLWKYSKKILTEEALSPWAHVVPKYLYVFSKVLYAMYNHSKYSKSSWENNYTSNMKHTVSSPTDFTHNGKLIRNVQTQ